VGMGASPLTGADSPSTAASCPLRAGIPPTRRPLSRSRLLVYTGRVRSIAEGHRQEVGWHGRTVAIVMKDEELRWGDAITAKQEERLVTATVAALEGLLLHPNVKDIRNPLRMGSTEHFTRLPYLDADGFFAASPIGFPPLKRREPDGSFVRDFRLSPGDVRKAVKRLEA